MKTIITKNIKDVVEQLKNGELVALPTETVYGLAANALDVDSVLKIFEVKKRPKFNPLIVHVADISDVRNYVKSIPEDAKLLMEKFSPGPVTFVLKKKSIIPDLVTAGLDTVAVRIPAHRLMRKVIRECGFPLCAPSANRFGKISPTSATDVKKELRGKIRYILDGGKCKVGIESTIISFENNLPVILRNGYVTREQILNVTGKVKEMKTEKIISPGMMKDHYAPETPMYIMTEVIDKNKFNSRTGFLFNGKIAKLSEAAAELFSRMRKLDEKKYDYIVTGLVENTGIGTAINERLLKAAKGIVRVKKGKVVFESK